MYGCVCKHNSQGLCWGRLGGRFGTFSDHKFIFMSWPARLSSVPAAWNSTRRSCSYFEGLLDKCLLISPYFQSCFPHTNLCLQEGQMLISSITCSPEQNSSLNKTFPFCRPLRQRKPWKGIQQMEELNFVPKVSDFSL